MSSSAISEGQTLQYHRAGAFEKRKMVDDTEERGFQGKTVRFRAFLGSRNRHKSEHGVSDPNALWFADRTRK